MENFILGEYLNYALHDDETPEGGIAYMGETVADFLGDAEEEPKSLEELNSLLTSCGIRPICHHTYHRVCVNLLPLPAPFYMEIPVPDDEDPDKYIENFIQDFVRENHVPPQSWCHA